MRMHNGHFRGFSKKKIGPQWWTLEVHAVVQFSFLVLMLDTNGLLVVAAVLAKR